MEPQFTTRLYTFDEHFSSLLNVRLVNRKSSHSPFQLQYRRLMALAAVAVFIQNLFFVLSIVRSIKAPTMDLLEICGAGAFLSSISICFCRGVALLVNHKKVKRLLHNLEQLFPVERAKQLDHHLKDCAEAIIKRNKAFRMLCTVASVAYFTMPIVQSLFECIIKGRKYPYIYPFICWHPFDDNRLAVYPFLYCFQTATICSAVSFFFIDDLIFSTTVSQMCMYYRYLGKLLTEIDARWESNTYSNLKKLIRFQYALERLRSDIDDIYSLSTFIGFTIMKITLCLFLFSSFQTIDIVNMLPFFTTILALIVMAYLRCTTGTDLYEASANLLFSIYDQNWYEGTPTYRKMIGTMMMRANKPINLEASKLNYIGMEYFQEIVRETYQIFTFLYNFSN